MNEQRVVSEVYMFGTCYTFQYKEIKKLPGDCYK